MERVKVSACLVGVPLMVVAVVVVMMMMMMALPLLHMCVMEMGRRVAKQK